MGEPNEITKSFNEYLKELLQDEKKREELFNDVLKRLEERRQKVLSFGSTETYKQTLAKLHEYLDNIKTEPKIVFYDEYRDEVENIYHRLQCRANMDERRLTESEHAEEFGWVRIYASVLDAGKQVIVASFHSSLSHALEMECTDVIYLDEFLEQIRL